MKQMRVFHHYFVNKCLSSMIRGLADYFSTEFFNRIQEVVIATYDKAVQHYRQRQMGEDIKMSIRYPFMSLSPDLEFEPDPQQGRFLWAYPSYASDLNLNMFEPLVYKDDHVALSVVLNRYQGRFDINTWCSSIYELMDFRLQSIQLFGGQERYIIPKNINGYIILPDEIVSFTYENPYEGQRYTLDWQNNSATQTVLIKNINQNRMVFPFTLRPYIKLVGMQSVVPGPGEDGDYRLVMSCEWECSIPTHIVVFVSTGPELTVKKLGEKASRIELDLHIDCEYYKLDSDDGFIFTFPRDFLKEYLFFDEEKQTWLKDSEFLTFVSKFNYILTEEDDQKIHSEPPVNFEVTLDQDIDVFRTLIQTKYGFMKRDFHWRVKEGTKNVVEFLSFNLQKLKSGDAIWFAFYEPGLNEGYL